MNISHPGHLGHFLGTFVQFGGLAVAVSAAAASLASRGRTRAHA
jgi:glycogen synthase